MKSKTKVYILGEEIDNLTQLSNRLLEADKVEQADFGVYLEAIPAWEHVIQAVYLTEGWDRNMNALNDVAKALVNKIPVYHNFTELIEDEAEGKFDTGVSAVELVRTLLSIGMLNAR